MSKVTDQNINKPRWVGDGSTINQSTSLGFFGSTSAPAGEEVLAGVAVWVDVVTGLVSTGLNPNSLSTELVMVEGIAITEITDNRQVLYQVGDLVAILSDGFAGVELPFTFVSEQAQVWVHEDTGVFSGLGGTGFHKVGNVYLVPSLCRSDFQVVNISPNLLKRFLQ